MSPAEAKLLCHCGALRNAARRVMGFYDTILKPSGLSMPQFGLLNLIRTAAKGSINTLAAQAGLDRTTASRTLRPWRTRPGPDRTLGAGWPPARHQPHPRGRKSYRAGRAALAQGPAAFRRRQWRGVRWFAA